MSRVKKIKQKTFFAITAMLLGVFFAEGSSVQGRRSKPKVTHLPKPEPQSLRPSWEKQMTKHPQPWLEYFWLDSVLPKSKYQMQADKVGCSESWLAYHWLELQKKELQSPPPPYGQQL